MSGQMTKRAYQKLIDENLEWLEANTSDCLERQHIIAIIKSSAGIEYAESDAHKLKLDLVAALRIGLNGDTKSLEMLARRSTQRYKMRDLMQPIFDEFPAAKGSPLRESS